MGETVDEWLSLSFRTIWASSEDECLLVSIVLTVGERWARWQGWPTQTCVSLFRGCHSTNPTLFLS